MAEHEHKQNQHDQEQGAAGVQPPKAASRGWSVMAASSSARQTVNPIRSIVDTLKIPAGAETEDKKLIPLSIGDPTKFGNFKTSEVFVRAVADAVHNFDVHGYQHSAGMPQARAAIAAREAVATGREVGADDVIIASGCSGALEIAIKGLASAGEAILVPAPGFPLYETVAKSYGIGVTFYPLVAERQWEADLDALERLVTPSTRAIVVNNPSNPCGSVYSKEHLRALLAFAERHRLVVLADEIYGNLVFSGETFFPLASLTRTVPVIAAGGVAKEFLAPGFRVGWLVVYDAPAGNGDGTVLQDVRQGLMTLTQIIVGANSLVQAALPAILTPAPGSADAEALASFRTRTVEQLERNSRTVVELLSSVPGLRVIKPQGAMYVMVAIDRSVLPLSDVDFSQRLLDDELVFVLPGSCFGLADAFRVVFCAPNEVLEAACQRIAKFCGAAVAAAAAAAAANVGEQGN